MRLVMQARDTRMYSQIDFIYISMGLHQCREFGTLTSWRWTDYNTQHSWWLHAGALYNNETIIMGLRKAFICHDSLVIVIFGDTQHGLDDDAIVEYTFFQAWTFSISFSSCFPGFLSLVSVEVSSHGDPIYFPWFQLCMLVMLLK